MALIQSSVFCFKVFSFRQIGLFPYKSWRKRGLKSSPSGLLSAALNKKGGPEAGIESPPLGMDTAAPRAVLGLETRTLHPNRAVLIFSCTEVF